MLTSPMVGAPSDKSRRRVHPAAYREVGNVVAMAPAARVFPAQPLQALGTMLSLTAALWVVEFYDQLTGERLDQDGIVPRSADGLEGIVWAPAAARRLGAPRSRTPCRS